jgi:thiosulfate dehydrogenase
MKTLTKAAFLSLLALLTGLAALRGANAYQTGPDGDPIAGGRIYDNWMLALDAPPPAGDHPLWRTQESNMRVGVATWRCAECHGWDYKGATGAYAPGSIHYTGFRGLRNSIGATQEEVAAWLDGANNQRHDFLQYMNPTAVDDLAAFLRTMQIDLDLIIDPDSGQALGDERVGRNLYLDACSSCHGGDGREINFSSNGRPTFVGDFASADPWRTVHVIRFGTVTGRMPGTEESGWSISRVGDLLAFAQTLPRGNPGFNIFNESSLSSPDLDRQGEIEPILWGAFAILGVILLTLAADALIQRRLPS